MTEAQKKEVIRLLNIKSSGPTFTTPADYEAFIETLVNKANEA
jgi:hypothetical protein